MPHPSEKFIKGNFERIDPGDVKTPNRKYEETSDTETYWTCPVCKDINKKTDTSCKNPNCKNNS